MKANLYHKVLIIILLLCANSEKAFASSFDGDLPAKIRQLRQEIRTNLMMLETPFDTGPYAAARVLPEDTQMKNACFKNMPQQDKTINRRSNDDLQIESTLSTDISTVIGSVADKCITAKSTAKFSPLDLNKWYLTSLVDPANPNKYYRSSGDSGSLYRAEASEGGNRMKNATRLVRPDATMLNSCSTELMVQNAAGATNIKDPVWMRRELDNCLNQYILQQGRFPRINENYKASYFGVNAKLCQPLNLELPPSKYDRYEYAPSEYLGVAWWKLLMDSSYKKNPAAGAEPDYLNHSKVKMVRKIDMPRESFGQILVEDLAESRATGGGVDLGYEKILDPSHPFSPRWDYQMQDRSLSAGGQMVFCADVPVDILTFRQGPFEQSIAKKISFNIVCGMNYGCRQMNNGCGMEMGNQCCSTAYTFQDRVSPLFKKACGLPIIDGCNFISRPLTPINTLKMREVNATNFQGGAAPEGYSFKDYFGNHKPYMRCWDTNTECGENQQIFSSSGGRFLYNPNSTKGSNYAILGAGREGESCMIGGGKGEGGVANPDPITSWSELKLYYVRATRMNVKCIVNHEKLFKNYTGEGGLLDSIGQSIALREKCANGTDGCYANVKMPFPWLGYLSDPQPAKRFPNFGNANVIVRNLGTGLDEALPNDVLLFGEDLVRTGNRAIDRNPYVGVVANAENAATRRANGGGANNSLEFVKIRAYNHGKYLDACGNTDMLGDSTVYTMFKTGLPEQYRTMFNAVGVNNNAPPGYTCLDPSLSACIEPLWNNIPRYKIEAAY